MNASIDAPSNQLIYLFVLPCLIINPHHQPGFFVNGGLGYSVIEYLRRLFTDLAGPSAATLEIPIILSSALISASIGSFTLAPFESVRIRAVAQPDYADNIVGVLNRIVTEEGAGSLFSAVPAFLPKEILFVCTKFLVFDLTTDYLYQTYPAANEDLKLSLLISLVGGTLGGIGAAIMSNPADATISEMKKSKSDVGALGAAQALLKRGGIPLLFRGLGLRMFFYALIVSIQFLVYDYVRYTLNIGSDDLKVYLDVLGGALSETGGPV
jgi:solute carrier family 25 phosphate transporter 3